MRFQQIFQTIRMFISFVTVIAGFGIAGVLSSHAPHDVPQPCTAMSMSLLGEQSQERQQQLEQQQAVLQAALHAAEAAGNYEEAEVLKKQAAAPAVSLVTPPYFARGSTSPAEIREACRKYAEAAAALQGHDLGLPSPNAPCLR